MNVLIPSAFLLLSLIPILILFYLLKLKRKKKQVPALWLWERVLHDKSANKPFQKLQRNLLLLLQLLILLFLIFAAARPFFNSKEITKDNLVVILDISASMKATDIGKSRFHAAKKEVVNLIEDMGEDQHMMIITAGKSASVVSGFTNDRLYLKKQLKEIDPVDTSSELAETVFLAISLIERKGDGEIFIYSDNTDELSEIQTSNIPIHFVAFGSHTENIAITALDIRYNPFTSMDYQVFVGFNNFYDRNVVFNLELFVDGKLINLKKVEMNPNSEHGVIFNLGTSFQGGLVEARLDFEDKLTVDNSALSFIPKKITNHILLVTSGNYFLEQALMVNPMFEVHKVKPTYFEDMKDRDYELIIFDDYSPEAIEYGNYIFINSTPPQLSITGEMDNPSVIDWDDESPILRFVDFSEVSIQKALQLADNRFLHPILFSEKSPLCWTYSDGKIRSIIFGFNLFDSNLPLKVGFPIFISNALKWITTGSEESYTGYIKTGEIYKITPPKSADKIVVTTPKQEKIDLTDAQKPIQFYQTDNVGMYSIDYGDSTKQFVVNLMDKFESNIQVGRSTTITDKTIDQEKATSKIIYSKYEIWRWIVLIALAIVFLEWYVFHKKPI